MPARHLIYNHVGHSDFIMSWRPKRSTAAAAPATAPPQGSGPHPRRRGAAGEEASPLPLARSATLGGQRAAPGVAAGGGELRGLLPFAKDFVRYALRGSPDQPARNRTRAHGNARMHRYSVGELDVHAAAWACYSQLHGNQQEAHGLHARLEPVASLQGRHLHCSHRSSAVNPLPACRLATGAVTAAGGRAIPMPLRARL